MCVYLQLIIRLSDRADPYLQIGIVMAQDKRDLSGAARFIESRLEKCAEAGELLVYCLSPLK